MTRRDIITTAQKAIASIVVAMATGTVSAQSAAQQDTAMAVAAADTTITDSVHTDSTIVGADSIAATISRAEAFTDSIARSIEAAAMASDSMAANDAQVLIGTNGTEGPDKPKAKRDWATWRPNPQRAMWLALVIPGAGQIYNRKYWKLPIIYGGFMGCLYALNWNNMMYKDYSQAYLDIMDSDPTTESYNQFLHLGQTINSSNEERYKEIFRNRRDRYRRWRDMSFFCLLGVYAISIIDAYVDAELSEFDISKDLSLKVEPAVINNNASRKVLEASSVGIQCKLRF